MLDVFCTTQIETAKFLKNEIINWENGLLKENELNIRITKIVEINKEIIYKNGKMGSIIKQRLGKKRIRLIETILRVEKGNQNEKY